MHRLERAQRIRGFLRRNSLHSGVTNLTLHRRHARNAAHEPALAKQCLIARIISEQVIAQLQTVLHDHATVDATLLSHHGERALKRALKRNDLL